MRVSMSNDKQSNVDEIATAGKIRLVVTDQVVEEDSSSLSSESGATNNEVAPQNLSDVVAEHSAEIPDAKKLIDLPADEYFRALERATPEQLQSILHAFEKTTRTKSGAKLFNKIIEVPSEPRTLVSLLVWWESRRPLYNIILMLVGVPSIVLLTCFYGWPLQVTVMSAVAYLFMANVCYTLGTPAEVVARTIYKEKAETYGPVLLTLGTIFSVFLTVVLELMVVGFMTLTMLL